MKLILTLIVLAFFRPAFSQDCAVKGEKDWELVSVRILKQRDAPHGFDYVGEWIERDISAKSINELSEKELKKIKQFVAKDKHCVVYLDFNGIVNDGAGLYYVWTNE